MEPTELCEGELDDEEDAPKGGDIGHGSFEYSGDAGYAFDIGERVRIRVRVRVRVTPSMSDRYLKIWMYKMKELMAAILHSVWYMLASSHKSSLPFRSTFN